MVRFREIPHISFSRDKGIAQVRGQLPHKSGDNPLPCQKKAVILHSKSDASHVHRTFIALPSHTRARVAAMSPARVPEAEACSSSASRVPKVGAADNRTEIISPANKQYKGRKSLAAF